MKVLAKLKPKHLNVVGSMAMVRNSVGAGQCDLPFTSPSFTLVLFPDVGACTCLPQTATWLTSWWCLVPVAESELGTPTLRGGWWWLTCSVRWRRRSCSTPGPSLLCWYSSPYCTSFTVIICAQAGSVVAPELFTIATLTGHAIRAMGPNYSVSTTETPPLLISHSQMRQSIYPHVFELLLCRSSWIMDQPTATKMLLTGKKVCSFFRCSHHLL